MIKDPVFASTLYQTANISSITTSYDNKFNRPEKVTNVITYQCRISRKTGAYAEDSGAKNDLTLQFRCYFEIDVDIKSGASIEIDGVNYKAGLVYKPMNHHVEIDLIKNAEA